MLKFKDLGLVILDEEQRFGVKAKEHLKKIKTASTASRYLQRPYLALLYMSLLA